MSIEKGRGYFYERYHHAEMFKNSGDEEDFSLLKRELDSFNNFDFKANEHTKSLEILKLVAANVFKEFFKYHKNSEHIENDISSYFQSKYEKCLKEIVEGKTLRNRFQLFYDKVINLTYKKEKIIKPSLMPSQSYVSPTHSDGVPSKDKPFISAAALPLPLPTLDELPPFPDVHALPSSNPPQLPEDLLSSFITPPPALPINKDPLPSIPLDGLQEIPLATFEKTEQPRFEPPSLQTSLPANGDPQKDNTPPVNDEKTNIIISENNEPKSPLQTIISPRVPPLQENGNNKTVSTTKVPEPLPNTQRIAQPEIAAVTEVPKQEQQIINTSYIKSEKASKMPDKKQFFLIRIWDFFCKKCEALGRWFSDRIKRKNKTNNQVN